ncbi:MAG: hypothetical protein JKY65_30175 [Planctomycetes bacterium]|nr:hypothetical protein [Planctomycetota bacterium]
MGLICERSPDEGESSLQGEYPIRSKVALTSPELRARVLGALYEGLTHGGPVAMCFEPHHAILATHGKERWEILVCYACSRIAVQRGGASLGRASIGSAGSEVLNQVLGQDGNIPSGEIQGRPFDYWIQRLKQIEEGDRDGERGVLGTLRAVLIGDVLPAENAGQILAQQRRRFAKAPLDVIDFLRRVIREGRRAPARLGALRLLKELARREPSDLEVAQRFVDSGTDLLVVIREKVRGEVGYDQAPKTATSPEIRKAAESALGAITWAEADRVEVWIQDTAGDGPLTQERLLGLLKPILERAKK